MPIRTDPERPGWQLLLDAGGAPVARFELLVRDGRRVADLLTRCPGIGVERAAGAVLADLRGMLVCGDEELGRALVAAGGQPRRHAHVLSRDLRAAPPTAPGPPPAGLRIAPADRRASDLAAAFRAAYPRDHPDFRAYPYPEDPALELAPLLDGRQVGPLLAASALALDGAGRVVGAALVNRAPGVPPDAGPWLTQLFRAPAHPGTGRALLEHALAALAGAGEEALGLAVTDGNPAERLYRALGFRRTFTAFNVQL
ncbi:MAG TPA: GNAT family N-acetyltransferase [Solirubrobacteraceae bacterium]